MKKTCLLLLSLTAATIFTAACTEEEAVEPMTAQDTTGVFPSVEYDYAAPQARLNLIYLNLKYLIHQL